MILSICSIGASLKGAGGGLVAVTPSLLPVLVVLLNQTHERGT